MRLIRFSVSPDVSSWTKLLADLQSAGSMSNPGIINPRISKSGIYKSGLTAQWAKGVINLADVYPLPKIALAFNAYNTGKFKAVILQYFG